MRAVVHPEFGEPADVLTVEQRPVPTPGAGQVLVRTVLSPIHNHDLWTIRGTYGFKPELPAQSGTEALGVVESLGEGVTHLSVGQRVAGGTFGVWAEYSVADAAGLIPVPDAMPDESAAQLVSMPFSAISLLHSLDLHEGDWLIQNAANGAVGRMVAQLGAARGINVIGLVRRAEGVEELRAQGIERIVATDTEGWQDQVTAITGGAPIRAGVESVGGKAAGDIASVLGDEATLVVFGAMASPTLEIPSGKVIFGQLTVKGFWGSVVSRTMPSETKQQLFGELISRVLDGSLTLPVSETFAFEDARDAVRASDTAGRVGKVLLRP
ncbi:MULTISPECIES: zinc-binding dehydrogenase [unclassified Curtobacterium]|uniref:zinc-binding dehydrogenase n=1 Tax=unclassified Curtobacterium TaxID=257496 RepID=UPI000DA80ED3|nr:MULTISPECIES: zinc-binding dehydrogenase [unclassified Curtobacterium]PZE66069.1 NADPH:quinone oxidoreductase [Curtobacterium sp. MCBD17_021]WIB28063.1 zinc-binding dehydrogenase [Curtobacterium sp. MCSS17_015]